ncbi:hypothetical protein ABT116_50515, partial [Streptomyces sp. NPDC002130]
MSERASSTTARQRLETPRGSRRFNLDFDVEAVGRVSERIARFLGTGRYLAIQTIIVIVSRASVRNARAPTQRPAQRCAPNAPPVRPNPD